MEKPPTNIEGSQMLTSGNHGKVMRTVYQLWHLQRRLGITFPVALPHSLQSRTVEHRGGRRATAQLKSSCNSSHPLQRLLIVLRSNAIWSAAAKSSFDCFSMVASTTALSWQNWHSTCSGTSTGQHLAHDSGLPSHPCSTLLSTVKPWPPQPGIMQGHTSTIANASALVIGLDILPAPFLERLPLGSFSKQVEKHLRRVNLAMPLGSHITDGNS
jgi:hypothetical protein